MVKKLGEGLLPQDKLHELASCSINLGKVVPQDANSRKEMKRHSKKSFELLVTDTWKELDLEENLLSAELDRLDKNDCMLFGPKDTNEDVQLLIFNMQLGENTNLNKYVESSIKPLIKGMDNIKELKGMDMHEYSFIEIPNLQAGKYEAFKHNFSINNRASYSIIIVVNDKAYYFDLRGEQAGIEKYSEEIPKIIETFKPIL